MTVAISKVSVVREVGRNKRIIGGSAETSSSYGGGGGGGSSTSPFLPSLDQTITGAWTFNDILTVKEGADKGLRFPPDAFGGTGDTATMTLESTIGEDLKWKFSLTNDTNDKFYFSAPSDNGMLFNDNIIYHAGNSNLSSIDWTTNDLNVYGDLIIRGEVINPTGEIILVDDAWVMLNNGNSEVDSGLRIDIDGAGTAFSSLYRKASDDSWYIDTAKIALSNGAIQTNLNSDFLDGYHAADFPRKVENATILGSWTYLGGVIFSGSDFGYRTLISADGSIDTYGGGVLQNRIASSGDNYLNRAGGKLKVGSSTVPTEKLDVDGNIKANGDGESTALETAMFNKYGVTNNRTVLHFTNNYVGGNIQFNISGGIGTNRMALLDSLGNFLIKGNLRREAHNTGHFEGSYNNISANDTYSNPIYTIGSSYNPELTTLANMYGLGYANANTATFLSWVGGTKTWGQYVAAGGTSRIFLDGSNGKIHTTGGIQGAGAFLSGFAGSNYFLNPNDGGDSHLTIDRLTVRGRMDVYELVINRIRATNGSLWVSDSGKVTSVTEDATYYTLYFDDDNGRKPQPFFNSDCIRCQQWDGKNIHLVNGVISATPTNIGINFVKLIKSQTTGIPVAGDEFVRIGNTTDTNRQGALYLTSSDNGSPYMDIIDGVTSSSLSGKSRLRVGKLSGIAGETGYGIWGSSDGVNEAFVISSGLSAPEGYARIAGWNFNNASIYKDFKGTGIQVFMGQDPILGTSTTVRGFGITKDVGNRMLMAQVGTGADFEISSLVGGKYHFQLLSTGINQIAGWNFGETTFSKLVNGVTVWMGNDPTNATYTGFGSYVNTSNYIRMISANGHSYLQGRYNNIQIFNLNTQTVSTIAGWNFDNDTLYSGEKWGTGTYKGLTLRGGASPLLIASRALDSYVYMNSESDTNWGIRGRLNGVDYFSLGYTNQIAGWNFDSNALWSGTKSVSGITLSASEKSLGAYKTATDYVKMFYTSTLDWGIDGKVGGVSVFQLGAINKIAGWNFDNTKFSSVNSLTILNSNGVINLYNDVSTSDTAKLSFYKKDSGVSTLVGEINTKYGSQLATGSTVRGLSISLEDSLFDRGRTAINIYTNTNTSQPSEYRTIFANGKFSSKGRSNPEAIIGLIDNTDPAKYDVIFMTTSSGSLPLPSTDENNAGHFFNGNKFTIVNIGTGTLTMSGYVSVTTEIPSKYCRTYVFYNGLWYPYTA